MSGSSPRPSGYFHLNPHFNHNVNFFHAPIASHFSIKIFCSASLFALCVGPTQNNNIKQQQHHEIGNPRFLRFLNMSPLKDIHFSQKPMRKKRPTVPTVDRWLGGRQRANYCCRGRRCMRAWSVGLIRSRWCKRVILAMVLACKKTSGYSNC